MLNCLEAVLLGSLLHHSANSQLIGDHSPKSLSVCVPERVHLYFCLVETGFIRLLTDIICSEFQGNKNKTSHNHIKLSHLYPQ